MTLYKLVKWQEDEKIWDGKVDLEKLDFPKSLNIGRIVRTVRTGPTLTISTSEGLFQLRGLPTEEKKK